MGEDMTVDREKARRELVAVLIASTGIEEYGAEGVADALLGPRGPIAALIAQARADEAAEERKRCGEALTALAVHSEPMPTETLLGKVAGLALRWEFGREG